LELRDYGGDPVETTIRIVSQNPAIIERVGRFFPRKPQITNWQTNYRLGQKAIRKMVRKLKTRLF
jgi:hypothetical protein